MSGFDHTRITMPDKPSLDGLETTWAARWESAGTYRFDRTAPRSQEIGRAHV